MRINTIAVSLIILPEAVVNVSICMNESSLSVGLVLDPPSFVHAPIRPNLDSATLAHILAIEPFSLVFSPIFELLFLLINSVSKAFWLVVELKIAQLRAYILNVGVDVVGLSLIVGGSV